MNFFSFDSFLGTFDTETLKDNAIPPYQTDCVNEFKNMHGLKVQVHGLIVPANNAERLTARKAKLHGAGSIWRFIKSQSTSNVAFFQCTQQKFGSSGKCGALLKLPRTQSFDKQLQKIHNTPKYFEMYRTVC